MEIEHFSSFSIKHLKVMKSNALTLFSIHFFKSILISFLSFCFYYKIMKFTIMLFSIAIYTFLKTCFLFNDMFFIIKHYVLYIFSKFVVCLLYHIRLIRLSSDIELNPGPKLSSFKYFSLCHWNSNSITHHKLLNF